MTLNYNYIFVDLDDTIWDFHANAKEALRDLFELKELKEHYDNFDYFYKVYASRNLELWTQYGQGLITKKYLTVERFLYPLLKIGINDQDLALRMNSIYLDSLATKTELIPHAKEFLEFCAKNGIPVTLISNGFVEVQYHKLRNSKIEKYFKHVVLSEQVGALKPNPKIFEHALRLNNANKNETLMIGDSFEADIIGAFGIGIDAIYLNRTRKKQELPNGVTEIDCFSEIYKYIYS